MSKRRYDIFISYSRKDKDSVDLFCSLFEAAGLTYWIDREGIGADQFKEVIVDAIECSELFVYFSSANSNISPWTAKEVGVAVDTKKNIVPVRIDSTPYNKAVKFDLVNLNFYDLSKTDGCGAVLLSVLKAIDEKLLHKVDWSSEKLNVLFDEYGIKLDTENSRRLRRKKLIRIAIIFAIIFCVACAFVSFRLLLPSDSIGLETHGQLDSLSVVQIEEVNKTQDSIRIDARNLRTVLSGEHIEEQQLKHAVGKLAHLGEKLNLFETKINSDTVRIVFAQTKSIYTSTVDSFADALSAMANEMRDIERYRWAELYQEQSSLINNYN